MSTETKPTPGPWTAYEWGDEWTVHNPDAPDEYGSEDQNVCRCDGPGAKSTAALIAAAGTAASECEALGYDGQAAIETLPKLLEALKAVAQKIDKASGSPTFTAAEHDALQSIIAKAEGGE